MTRSPAAVPAPTLALLATGAALAWTVHLLASYLVVTVWCASGWRGMDIALVAVTVVCAAAAAVTGVAAFRLWRRGQAAQRHDGESGRPEPWDGRMGERGARTAFIAVLALFMTAIFGYLILLQGVPALFGTSCPPGVAP